MLTFCLAEHLFFWFVLVVCGFFVCFLYWNWYFSLLACIIFLVFLNQEVLTFPLGLGNVSLCLFLRDLHFSCIFCQGRKNSSEYSLPRRAENRKILQHSSETPAADHQEILRTSGMIQYELLCSSRVFRLTGFVAYSCRLQEYSSNYSWTNEYL